MTAQNKDEKMSKTEEKEEETESRTKHRGMKRAQSANIAEKKRNSDCWFRNNFSSLLLYRPMSDKPRSPESEYT